MQHSSGGICNIMIVTRKVEQNIEVLSCIQKMLLRLGEKRNAGLKNFRRVDVSQQRIQNEHFSHILKLRHGFEV